MSPWLLFCLLMLAVATSTARRLPRDANYTVCHTKQCNEFATRILTSMNTSIDPCEDFFGYACGSWKKLHPMVEQIGSWSMMKEVNELTEEHIRDVVEEEETPNEIEPLKMLRRFYRSCMDTSAIEAQGIDHLMKLVDAGGGWPITMPDDVWDAKNITWQDVQTVYYHLDATLVFYKFLSVADEKNATINMFAVTLDVTYPFNTLLNIAKAEGTDDYRETLKKTIVLSAQAVAKMKGMNISAEKLTKDAEQILQLQQEMIEITKNAKRLASLDSNLKKITIKEMQEWYDSRRGDHPTNAINWLETIKLCYYPMKVDINETELIYFESNEFFEKMMTLLGKTSSRTLVNYVQWHLFSTYMAYTTEYFRALARESSAVIEDYMKDEVRWKICVRQIGMRNVISYRFVKKYTSDETLKVVEEMLKAIQDEFAAQIESSEWISRSMKDSMLEKLQEIIMLYGYPAWYKNDSALIQYYEGLTINDNYFDNMLNYKQHKMKKDMQLFMKPVDRHTWLEIPIVVNAFYSRQTNSMILPASNFQEPFFSSKYSIPINYGTFGFTIGHELGHGFDHDGIKYDKLGNKIFNNSEEMQEAYKKRATCFTDQFNQYQYNAVDEEGNPIMLDGELTQNENIADSTGIQVAFQAYQAKQKDRVFERLPGLEEFDDRQIFFLSFATAWCDAFKPEIELETVNSDEHSPAKYRIIGSLSNMNAFADTFKCSNSSFMNPKKKCSLWK